MLHLKACYRMVLLVYVVAIQAKFDLWLLVFRALLDCRSQRGIIFRATSGIASFSFTP